VFYSPFIWSQWGDGHGSIGLLQALFFLFFFCLARLLLALTQHSLAFTLHSLAFTLHFVCIRSHSPAFTRIHLQSLAFTCIHPHSRIRCIRLSGVGSSSGGPMYMKLITVRKMLWLIFLCTWKVVQNSSNKYFHLYPHSKIMQRCFFSILGHL